ncbi:hypothetical protein [Stutzerimonas kirkiae]|uniref:hypothetical protein n=1 Tax=Stutzerimonas kirkiae TaxID=2211392 RepID=UPI001A954CA8|nr:hypothetical protein [Stutzerimonas kirkiae]
MAMSGGKLPRQRMWEAIRTLAKSNVALTTYNVSRRSGLDDEAVRDYLRALGKAGIVRQLQAMARDALWELVSDEGAEAPRVNKRGERQPPEAVECIWRALRILGELNATEASAQAAAGGATISEHGARIYLQGLALAGYVSRSGGTPGVPAIYRLLPGRYSGPLHPIYQRCTYEQVYDPNLDKVVWVKGQQPDPAELSGLRIEVERLRKLLDEWLWANEWTDAQAAPGGLVERTQAEIPE